MARKTDDDFTFEGFRYPTYTQVPDELFDVLMPRLSEAEIKCLLYIMRRTFGFHKESDAISTQRSVKGIVTRDGRQLDRGTGLSETGVSVGLKGLRQKGIVLVERRRSPEGDYEVNVYRLRFNLQTGGGSFFCEGGFPAERGYKIESNKKQIRRSPSLPSSSICVSKPAPANSRTWNTCPPTSSRFITCGPGPSWARTRPWTRRRRRGTSPRARSPPAWSRTATRRWPTSSGSWRASWACRREPTSVAASRIGRRPWPAGQSRRAVADTGDPPSGGSHHSSVWRTPSA